MISILLEIGGKQNSNIGLRVGKNDKEHLPVTLGSVLENNRPNRIRIRITLQKRLLIFINTVLKFDKKLTSIPNFKYVSFATKNTSNVEYYFNCQKQKSKPSSLPSNLNHALILALIVSLCINLLTFVFIFIILCASC